MKESLQRIVTTAASLLVCAAIVTACSTADAQDRTLFGGVGIPDMSPQQDTGPRFELPRLFSPREKNNSIAPATPAINWPNLNPFSNQMADGLQMERPRLFGEMPQLNLFPPLNPNRPRPFEEFNRKSKEFFSRTTDNLNQWAADQHQRNTETWKNLTQGLRPGGWQSETPQAQPPLRSAELMDGGNRIRF